MTAWAALEAFILAHREHGPLAVITAVPDSTGYDLTTACPCGAELTRRVAREDVPRAQEAR